jgi:hypothetical protein
MSIFKDFWYDLIHGSFYEKLLALVMFALIGTIFAAFLFLGFYLINTVGTKSRIIEAQLVSAKSTPAWVQVQMVQVGKVSVPQTIAHPASWSVTVVTIEDEILSCPCPFIFFCNFKEHRDVTATVSSGRLFGDTFCRGVKPIN